MTDIETDLYLAKAEVSTLKRQLYRLERENAELASKIMMIQRVVMDDGGTQDVLKTDYK